jgi:type 1 glutamine amidotransferase
MFGRWASLAAGALVLFFTGDLPAQSQATAAKKKIVFVAGKPSHAYGAHEHNAGCRLLAARLQEAMPSITCDVHYNGWPADANAFDGADCLVMYCDGGERHMVNEHLDQVDALAKKGVGIVCIHYGVEVPKGPSGEKFLDWIGGYFEANWSVNPHWTARFEKYPDHPITRGVGPIEINDEWYYHMRFRDGMKGVTPILTALPPKESLSRPDGTHSGNPHVRAAVLDRQEPQHMAWAAEREGGGRGFGFTGGHRHKNWGDDNHRKVVLNALVWLCKLEVPADGVASAVTEEDLKQNLDPKGKK